MTLSLFSVAPYISSPLEAIGGAVSKMPDQWRQNAQFQAMQKMRQQQIAHQNLMNKYQGIVNALAPETIKTKNEYLHHMASGGSPHIISTSSGFMAVNPLTGHATPVTGPFGKPVFGTQANLANKVATGEYNAVIGPNGMQIVKNPEYQAPVTTDQSGFTQNSLTTPPLISNPTSQVNVNQQQPGVSGGGSGVVVMQSSPHSSRSTGGETLHDVNTNQSISVPTKTTASLLQKSLFGDSSVLPLVTDFYNKTAPVVGGGMKAVNRVYQDVLGGLGLKQDPKYPTAAAAEKTAVGWVDKLAKAYNVTLTNESLKAFANMVQPSMLESPQEYKNAIANVVTQVYLGSEQAKKVLKGGFTLNNGKAEFDPAIVNQIRSNVLSYLNQKDNSNSSKKVLNKTIPEQNLQEGMVRVRRPDGMTGSIPAYQLSYALQQGWEHVK